MKISVNMKLLAATGFLLASLSAASAQSLPCPKLTNTEWIANFAGGNLNSTSFVRLDNSTSTFTVGGSSKSCVLVQFSIVGAATSFDPAFGNAVLFRALLDEQITNAGPAAQMLQASRNIQMGDNSADAHTYQFVFPSVAPGPHDVAIQARVLNAGNPPSTPPGGSFQQWIMTVRHR
jgi:hypothetical protein